MSLKKTLYINGDSHTAGTYLNDWYNHEKCFGALLSKKYNLNYINQAIAGGSNDRIIRTSKEHLTECDPKETIILIGWSTFERTEWFYKGEWYQICGQPQYEIKEKYLDRLWEDYTNSFWKGVNENQMEEKTFYLSRAIEAQYRIKEFGEWLTERKFKHLFFHAHSSFFSKKNSFQIEWPNNIWLQNQPYNPAVSFCSYALSKGHTPDKWWHFDYNAHSDYAKFIDLDFLKLLQ